MPATATGLTPGDPVPLPPRRVQHPGHGSSPTSATTRPSRRPPRPVPLRRRSRRPIPTPTAPATLPTAAPVPTLGTSVVVAPVKGTVLVKVPGAAGFVPLGGANGAVPTGAILDTRNGQVALTTALDGGRTQTATFERGVFEVRQSKTGHGLTDIFLRGPAPACGTSRATGRAAAGHQEEAEEAPALGARQGRPLPHARQQQRRDRPRHLVDHDRHLHRDAHDREGGRRLGPRRAPASHRPRARRPQLSRAPALASGPWRDRFSASSTRSARAARTSPPSS